MFENCGAKIKIFAKVLFAIDIVSLLVFAILCFVAKEVLIGILIIVLEFPISWLMALLLYGFGEIVENHSPTIHKVVINKTNTTDKKCPSCGASIGVNRTSCPNCGYNLYLNSKKVSTENPSGWLCDECGYKNSNKDIFCLNCGHKK